MKTESGNSIEERRLLLLRYLEGLLAEEERKAVEQLLESSKEAFSEFDELKDMLRIMRKDDRVFCPEPSLISDFIETGQDPSVELSKHLRDCEACREEAAALEKCRDAGNMPRELFQAIKKELGAVSKATPPPPDRAWLLMLLEDLASLFRFRVAAAVAVAVAVLLVLIFYPAPPAAPVVALSSVTWGEREDDLGGALLGAVPRARKRVTTILRFQDTEKPLSREMIDSLYRAVTPSEKVLDQYDFVSPAKVKEVATAAGSSVGNLNDMLSILRTSLGIENVALVTIVFAGSRAFVKSELIETSTGNRVGAEAHDMFDRTELESKIGPLVYGAFPLKGPRHE